MVGKLSSRWCTTMRCPILGHAEGLHTSNLFCFCFFLFSFFFNRNSGNLPPPSPPPPFILMNPPDAAPRPTKRRRTTEKAIEIDLLTPPLPTTSSSPPPLPAPPEVIELSDSSDGSVDEGCCVIEGANQTPVSKASQARINPLERLMANRIVFDMAKVKCLEGLYQFENFITEGEAAGLIESFNTIHEVWPDTYNAGQHRSFSWGVKADYSAKKNRKPNPSAGELTTPDFLQPFIERICEPDRPWSCITANWRPNEGNVNCYVKSRGDFLRDHYDDRALSGPIVASLTLTGSCRLSFKDFGRTATQPQVVAGTVTSLSCHHVPLHALSLQLLTGKARYNYTHGCPNEDLGDKPRYVVVFRMAKM